MRLSPEVTQSPQGIPLLDGCLGGKKLWNYRPKAAGHQLLPKSRAEAGEVALWAVHAGEGMETLRLSPVSADSSGWHWDLGGHGEPTSG